MIFFLWTVNYSAHLKDLKVTTAHCSNKVCDLLHHDYRDDVLRAGNLMFQFVTVRHLD